MSVSAGSPHVYGLLLAFAGLVALSVWMLLARRRGRVGGRRWATAAGAMALLALVGLFGNGPYVTRLSTFLWPRHLPPRVADEHVHAALRTATSPEFLRYWASLRGEPLLFDPEGVQTSLDVRLVSYAEARAEGVSISPEPPADAPIVLFAYHDEANALAVMAGLGKQARDQRFALARDLASSHLRDLIALEALRAARSPAERLEVMTQMGGGVPVAAEWTARELRRAREGASPEEAAALDARLSAVQRYIDEPALRGLPPGRRVALP